MKRSELKKLIKEVLVEDTYDEFPAKKIKELLYSILLKFEAFSPSFSGNLKTVAREITDAMYADNIDDKEFSKNYTEKEAVERLTKANDILASVLN